MPFAARYMCSTAYLSREWSKDQLIWRTNMQWNRLLRPDMITSSQGTEPSLTACITESATTIESPVTSMRRSLTRIHCRKWSMLSSTNRDLKRAAFHKSSLQRSAQRMFHWHCARANAADSSMNCPREPGDGSCQSVCRLYIVLRNYKSTL